jgi:hypothetical protein
VASASRSTCRELGWSSNFNACADAVCTSPRDDGADAPARSAAAPRRTTTGRAHLVARFWRGFPMSFEVRVYCEAVLRLWIFVASAALLLTACSDSGSSGTGGGATTATTTSSSSTGSPTCETHGGKCVDVPAGFKGPVDLREDAPTPCDDTAFEGGYIEDPFVASPATCACSCSSPNANCDVEGTAYAASDCTGASATFDATPPFCGNPPDLGAPTLAVTLVATPNDTTYCASDNAPGVRPDVVFSPSVTGCNPSIGTCSTGGCIATGATKYCVYSFNATSCPAGFDEKHTVIQKVDLDDTRDCSCLCGFPVLINCSPTATLSIDSQCVSDVASDVSGDCIYSTNSDTIAGVTVDPGATADCSSFQEVPSGTVTIGGSGTLVCCTSI